MANKNKENVGIVKQVKITINDVEYTLEYNRASIKMMERKGLKLKAIDDALITSIDLLIEGSLKMHHPRLSDAQIETIIDTIYKEYDCTALFEVLSEMLGNALPMFDEKGSSEKKGFTVIR